MTNQRHKGAINSLTNLKTKGTSEQINIQQIQKKVRLLGNCMSKSY